MTCARREAGARRPAPSTQAPSTPADSPRRPEPHYFGRARARLFSFLPLLPALALLLGALALFHAAPAAAQTLTAPTNLSVTAGDASLTVTWDATSYTPSAASVRWRVKDTNTNMAGNQPGSWVPSNGVTVPTAQVNARRIVIPPTGCSAVQNFCDPLTNGVTYEVQVTLQVSSQSTGFVSAGDGTPVAPPLAAPTNLSVTSGDAALGLTWVQPTGTVTGYDVHYTSALAGTVGNNVAVQTGSMATAASGWVENANTDRTSTSDAIFDLANGTPYRVRVRAKNAGGNGAWVFGSGTPAIVLEWGTTTETTAEGSRLNRLLKAGNVSAAISGTVTYAAGNSNPASLTDDLTTGYATSFSAAANERAAIFLAVPVNDTVNEEHETYTITINAGTGYTVGTPATLLVTITDKDPPAAPSGLSLAAGNAQLAAAWTKPAGPVAGYQLRYKETAATDQTATTPNDPSTGWVTLTPSGTGTSADITGLTNGTAYHVQVRATDGQTQTGNGYGAWSASQSGTPATQSTNANLSALTATSSTFDSTAFTALSIGAFAAGTTAYTATVPNQVDEVKLRPTVAESNASVEVGKQGETLSSVTSNTDSAAISLSVGANAITVKVTAQDGTEKTYTVTVTREAPQAQNNPAPTGLTVTPGDERLDVSWDPPPASVGTVGAYEVHYTSASSATVANGQAASTLQTDPAAGWIIALGSAAASTTPSHTITGLTNGTAYRVRVSYYLSDLTASNWAYATGTPKAPPKPTVTLSAFPGTVGEGSPVTVTARLSRSLSNAVTIPVTLTRNTSESGDHGSLASITVAAGATTGTGTITTTADADEDDETFTVALGTLPSSLTAGSPSSVQVTISEGPRVTLSVSPNPVPEGGTVTLTATLTEALSEDLTVYIDQSSGTSEPSSDYELFSELTIPAGRTTGTGRFATKHDVDADDETFTVSVSHTSYVWRDGEGGPRTDVSVGSPAAVEVTIEDDDTTVITLSAEHARVPEGGLNWITITFSDPVPLHTSVSSGNRQLTVWAQVTDANSGAELARVPVRVNGGATTSGFHAGSEVDEDGDDERITVTLLKDGLPAWASLGEPKSVTYTVDDAREATVSLSVSPARVTEGESVTVTATLDKALSDRRSELQVPIELIPGTAEDGDFWAPLRYIEVPAGATTGTLEVQARHDGDTGDETFKVSLRAQRAQVAKGEPSAVWVTIVDDDEAPYELSVADAEAEETSFPPSLLFAVTLNRAAPYRIVVNYHTKDGTAEYGNDYVGVLPDWAYALIFEPGETRKVVRVPVIDDTIEDSGETLKLVLFNPQGAALRDPEGIGTILNDDPPPGAARNTGATPTDTGDTTTDTGTGNTGTGGSTDIGNSNTDTNTGGSTNTGNSNTDTNTGGNTNTGGGGNTGGGNTGGNTNTNTGGGGRTSVPAGDAALAALSVLGNDKRVAALDPAFDPDTTDYASEVPHAVSAVRLIPTRRDRRAALSIGGQPLARGAEADFIALDVGRNVIEVVVTAEDGTTRTYTVTLTRAPAPAPAADLPALVVTGDDDTDVTLSPAFDPDTTDYEASLAHDVSAVTLTPAAPAGPARITVAGAPVAPGRDSAPVALAVGSNPVEVVVSTADGGATRTYTVTLHRAAAPAGPAADRRALPDLARALADDTQDSIATRLETGRRGGPTTAATPTLTRLGQALAGVLPGQSLSTPAPAAFDPARADARVNSGWVQPTGPVNWQALLDNADFVLPLHAAPADGDPPTGLDSLTLWSDGSYRQLRGHSDGLAWDGDLLGARLGAELRLSPSLTAGTAAGWQRAGWDERGEDRHTLTLLGVNPYAGWTGKRLDAWVSGGLGWGALDSRRDAATHREDVTTRTVSGGLNTRLRETAALTLKLKAEGLLTGLKTDTAGTNAHRLRLGLEAGHTRTLGQAGVFTPTLQLGLRHDGGDGPGGTGMELGGAVHYTGGALTLHGQGRTLIGRDGYREWGVQGAAEWRARTDGRGLVLSLSPGVGYALSGIEQLWTRGLREDAARQARRDYSARLDLRLDYGWDAPHHRGRLTPYLGVQLQHTARVRAGLRWAAPGHLQLHLLGERSDGQGGRDADHALLLEGTLRF